MVTDCHSNAGRRGRCNCCSYFAEEVTVSERSRDELKDTKEVADWDPHLPNLV